MTKQLDFSFQSFLFSFFSLLSPSLFFQLPFPAVYSAPVSPHAVQCLVLRVALLANILILTTPMLSVHMVPKIECDIISDIIYKGRMLLT